MKALIRATSFRSGCVSTLTCVCSDPDDQVFIDLSVAHGAQLVSKDKAVLSMKKRLALRGVAVRSALA